MARHKSVGENCLFKIVIKWIQVYGKGILTGQQNIGLPLWLICRIKEILHQALLPVIFFFSGKSSVINYQNSFAASINVKNNWETTYVWLLTSVAILYVQRGKTWGEREIETWHQEMTRVWSVVKNAANCTTNGFAAGLPYFDFVFWLCYGLCIYIVLQIMWLWKTVHCF